MGYYICMEDLVSNAFIAVGKQNKRFLSYTVLEQYGNAVAQALERKNFKSVFRLSRFYTELFLQEYADYFFETEEKGEKGICLKKGRHTEELTYRFCGSLPLVLLQAYRNENFLNILLK